jgi:integrase
VAARLTLQARHARSCPQYPKTSFETATKKHGCTCAPSYSLRGWHNGKLTWEPVGQNRKEAQRALDARRGDIAQRKYRVVQDVRFDEWAESWLKDFTGKANTARVYRHTIDYAKKAFGGTKVRDLTTADVRRFLRTIEQATVERRPKQEGEPQREVSPATLAKHLRQLSGCLQAAIAEGYAVENPVRQLSKSLRPKVGKSKPAYFTDAELARLWPELTYRPVFTALCKTAVGTGARFGELAALRWGDVDLLNREVHVARTFVEGLGEQPSTKSGEPRTLDLVPSAASTLEAWYAESGSPGDDQLVFEREEGGHLTPGYVTRQVLYPALERAGIPRVGERGNKRDFHSLRHTFARIALEGGAEITWVQKQLGHSSIVLTVDTYGSWARTAEKAQAERLADAFTL